MASQRGNRAGDYAFWRGDLLPAWLFFIEFAIIVGATATAMIIPYGFVSWVLLAALYVVAWAIPVIVMIPRSAPPDWEQANIAETMAGTRSGSGPGQRSQGSR